MSFIMVFLYTIDSVRSEEGHIDDVSKQNLPSDMALEKGEELITWEKYLLGEAYGAGFYDSKDSEECKPSEFNPLLEKDRELFEENKISHEDVEEESGPAEQRPFFGCEGVADQSASFVLFPPLVTKEDSKSLVLPNEGSDKKGAESRSSNEEKELQTTRGLFSSQSETALATLKPNPGAFIRPMEQSRRPFCCSPLFNYLRALGCSGDPLPRKEVLEMEKILLFSCYGRTQAVATTAMASVFLEKFRTDYAKTGFFYSRFFPHIITIATGGLPGAQIAMDRSLDMINDEISILPANLSMDALSLVTTPAWMIAKGIVKGVLGSGDSKSSSDHGPTPSLPVQYEVFEHKPLYEKLGEMFGTEKPPSGLKSKLYVHSASPDSSIRTQVMKSIVQYDLKQALKNSQITKDALLSFARLGAEKLGLEGENIDKVVEFFGKSENIDKFIPYETIIEELYDREISKRRLIVSFSSRTSDGPLGMTVSPVVRGRVAHIDYCMYIPKEMYKARSVNVQVFKDKALECMGGGSKYDGIARLTRATYDLMNRYLDFI